MYIAGIDIGGTKCAAVLGKCVDNNIIQVDVVDKVTFKTSSCNGPTAVIDRLILGLEDILAKNFLISNDISCIGISCGGPLNSEKGLILSPPNLIGWDNVPITDIFEKHFNVKAVPFPQRVIGNLIGNALMSLVVVEPAGTHLRA